jgi:hypothetical protein
MAWFDLSWFTRWFSWLRPPRQHGASSFHLFWRGVPDDVVSAAAVLEVAVRPSVDELYFWALQASFDGPSGRTGGAHLGLQHHPGYPGQTAANWGGYDDVRGGTFEGTVSELPSALSNDNTRNFAWTPHRKYRLEISRGASGWWQGSVTDIETGATTIIRELNGHDGDRLTGLAVWSEVFAPCDAPSASVRWTDLEYVTADGRRGMPLGLEVGYQADASGGCGNTDSKLEGSAAIQQTNTSRITARGTHLPWSEPPE